MPILLYGMNHASAPIDLRERVALPPGDLTGAVARLMHFDGIEEGLILSTCNRTELLVNADADETSVHLKRFLEKERSVSESELVRHCYLHANKDAVRHVFRVASSLDSMVVGEPQILGQLKESYASSAAVGTSGPVLHRCFHKAFAVAKRVRRETAIAMKAVSVASAAVELARSIFDNLDGRTAMLIGAGEMSALTARHLMAHGVRSLLVTNG